MSVWAVVVAAGSGSRFGGQKQFADLLGRPVVSWSLATARQVCDGVVLVVSPGMDSTSEWDADAVVAGGSTRSASVRRGLAAVPDGAEIIAVHDAARPLARLHLWRAVIDSVAGGADAAVPGASVTDTIKEVGPNGRFVTLDRSKLVAVQTPQAFRASLLRRVHGEERDATDDAALIEAAGGRVALVDGPLDNIKVTTPADLLFAAAVLEARQAE